MFLKFEKARNMSLEIHRLTKNPTEAWNELSKQQKVIRVNVQQPKTPVADNKVRIVCMSDTHSRTAQLPFQVPEGDIFIHAGDFTKVGLKKEVIDFNDWLGTLPHKHKIVIAGNHELSFDDSLTCQLSPSTSDKSTHTGHSLVDHIPTLGMPKENITEALKTSNIRNCLTNCTYLEDSEITLYGIKFYGSPWQPEFCKWAFGLPRGRELLKKWDVIPEDTDILITHTPPIGHGDLCCTGVRAGCVELLSTVQQRVHPNYHVFGHIHEGYGVSSDGQIIFINASTCNISYLPRNPPIVFDVPLPAGTKK